jgi:hypothetical protein
MKALVILAAAIVAGCSGADRPSQVTLDRYTVDGWAYAVAGASVMGRVVAPTPIPVPLPAPAGQCSNCKGTGKLPGDGKIFPTCPVCKGTGKALAKPTAKAAPRPVAKSTCSSGVCGAPGAHSVTQPRYRAMRFRR